MRTELRVDFRHTGSLPMLFTRRFYIEQVGLLCLQTCSANDSGIITEFRYAKTRLVGSVF
jgi:hypothetical protein